jgi:hypothetical protein
LENGAHSANSLQTDKCVSEVVNIGNKNFAVYDEVLRDYRFRTLILTVIQMVTLACGIIKLILTLAVQYTRSYNRFQVKKLRSAVRRM